MKEKDIQAAIMDYLLKCPQVSFAIVNTCGLVRKGKYKMYVGYPGLPDITGMLKTGQYFGIEVKGGKTATSDLQIDFINKINNHGGRAGIARSIEQAKDIINGI